MWRMGWWIWRWDLSGLLGKGETRLFSVPLCAVVDLGMEGRMG